MTAYPAAGDYYKAVQFPSRSFTVPRLQAAEFVWDSLGPTLARGSSAVVFQAAVEGRTQALRCYIRNDASSRDRYSALNVYLASHDLRPYVSGTTWLDEAITVNRTSWPVLTMEWIDGRTLNEYVDFLVSGSNTAALTTLAANWRELVALLQRSEFGHGDLQHGNVMVDQEGQFRLVDFDGVWIPQLAGQPPPTEFGHPNYQHPGLRVWDRWVDSFSALVIYLSLTALGRDPALWLALYNSKNLLFAKNDFFPPFDTEVWKQLAALRDPQVDALTRRLQECCAPDWVSNGSLESLLDQRSPSPAPPVPAGQRWWEQPATAAAPSPSRPAPSPSGPAPSPSGPSPSPSPSGPSPSPSGPAATPSRPWPPSSSASGAPYSSAPSPSSAAAAQPSSAAAGSPSGGVTLPTPPPLSAPLSTAGTGPLPQLSQKMVPPGDTIWWSLPGAGSGAPRPGSAGSMPPAPGPYAPGPQGPGSQRPGAQGPSPYGPGPHGSAPSAPMPQGYAPYPGQPAPGPGPFHPVQPSARPAAKSQPAPLLGGVALGLGIVLLIIGASAGLSIVVIGGLVAGAWGIWRLVTTSGNGPRSGSGPGSQPPPSSGSQPPPYSGP
jgi:eukaryotic-like serine/threonine-protein kinase